MRYSISLTASTGSPGMLYRIIQPEADKKDRSEIKIKKGKNSISLIISAADTVALKSSFNSVLKALTIYEKTEGLLDKNG